MARYTKESLENLRNRIDLADVLSQHIQLKNAGGALKALCPFHDEKSPSFMLQKGDTHYHCFGCGAHGDAIAFLMQHLRMSFYDAVAYLADRFQVRLEEIEGADNEKKISRGRLKQALECATTFYQFFLLHTKEGEEALSYLYSRGLTLDFITAFRIGLSPAHEGLFRKLAKQDGFSDEILTASGLTVERSGRSKEFFLERIMFPILDPMGSVIGFSARKFKEATYGGKYINTQETELFKKSKVLFGLHYSRKRIAKERQAIIVEGQLDALRLIYNGFDFTVAGQGTAFGESHVRELIQLGVTRVFLLLDGDEAGRQATVKIGHLFQKEGVEVLVVTLPQGKDPDLLLLEQGPPAIVHHLSHAEEYLAFLFHYFSKGKGVDLSSPAAKNQLLQELSSRIRDWDNPVMVHESMKKLASLANVPEELLGVGSRVTPFLPQKRSLSNDASAQGVDPDRILEGDLLRWLIVCGTANPRLFELCQHNLSPSAFRLKLAERLYQHIMQGYLEKKTFDFLEFANLVDEEELGSFLSEVLCKKVNREKAEALLIETIQRMKERNWMLEREEVRLRIHSGLADEKELLELVRRFDELKRTPPKTALSVK